MKNDIYLEGVVGDDLTLKSIRELVDKSDKSQPLDVSINSPGGDVYQGEAIYNYLKGLDQEVNTHAVGLVASMASIFYLAGKKRTAHKGSNNIYIHLPLGGSFGNAKDLEKDAKELRRIEDKMSNIYALETNLTKKEALELMRNEGMVETDFLLEKGIVTEMLEFKAVATLNINKNNRDMSDIEKRQKTFLSQLENLFKKAPKAIMVTLEDGTKLDFEREEGEPQVGDKATYNGENAEGDYILPNETVYNFVDGELKNITEKEVEEEEVVEGQLTADDVQAIVQEALKPVLENITAVMKDSKKYKSTMESLGNIVASTASEKKQKGNSTSEPNGVEDENPWNVLTNKN